MEVGLHLCSTGVPSTVIFQLPPDSKDFGDTGRACRILCREARTSPSQVRMNLSPNQTTKSDTMGLRLQEADNFMDETQWLLWWKRGKKSNKSLVEIQDTLGSQPEDEWVWSLFVERHTYSQACPGRCSGSQTWPLEQLQWGTYADWHSYAYSSTSVVGQEKPRSLVSSAERIFLECFLHSTMKVTNYKVLAVRHLLLCIPCIETQNTGSFLPWRGSLRVWWFLQMLPLRTPSKHWATRGEPWVRADTVEGLIKVCFSLYCTTENSCLHEKQHAFEDVQRHSSHSLKLFMKALC